MLSPLLLIGLSFILMLAAVLIVASRQMRRRYQNAVNEALAMDAGQPPGILTQTDIDHLPQAAQRYLRFCGAMGKPKVQHVKVTAGGRMRLSRKSGWADIRIEQYDFFGDELTRIFYIDLRILCFHMYGLHLYNRDIARMTGKLAGLIKVLDVSGPEMRVGDTVTLLNDLCLFAPAALVDKRIQWEEIDARSVKAVFHTAHCTVSAILVFGEDGRLLDFISEDRYYTEPGGALRKLRWSTPVTAYRKKSGTRLFAAGKASWHFPDGEYCYITFDEIQGIEYNV